MDYKVPDAEPRSIHEENRQSIAIARSRRNAVLADLIGAPFRLLMSYFRCRRTDDRQSSTHNSSHELSSAQLPRRPIDPASAALAANGGNPLWKQQPAATPRPTSASKLFLLEGEQSLSPNTRADWCQPSRTSPIRQRIEFLLYRQAKSSNDETMHQDTEPGASQDVVYEAGEARGPAALRVGRP